MFVPSSDFQSGMLQFGKEPAQFLCHQWLFALSFSDNLEPLIRDAQPLIQQRAFEMLRGKPEIPGLLL